MSFQIEEILTMSLICRETLLWLKNVRMGKMSSLDQENWYF